MALALPTPTGTELNVAGVIVPRITPTPTTQFSAPPECLDPDNLWIITTSCYLTSPNPNIYTPDWLTCTITNFGAPDWYNTPCYQPYPPHTTQGSEIVYYDGCPSGYTEVWSTSGAGYDSYEYTDGYYDATYYYTECCPSVYSMTTTPSDLQSLVTSFEGQRYLGFLYPLPGCYAPRVAQLSGSDVPMYTTSNTMAWDKRQDPGEGFATTVSWDYDLGTLFAMTQSATRTVFMGTHTCYESCTTWMSYYYPDGVGGPEPTTTATPTPTPSESAVETAQTTTAVTTTSGESGLSSAGSYQSAASTTNITPINGTTSSTTTGSSASNQTSTSAGEVSSSLWSLQVLGIFVTSALILAQ
ncbi:hypothetical protein BX600DRAFT_551284 [Xylariales sp. PMI_506]|nr:hypothetical protein BX600DRAFT_551284 [Xylariales sp. PMI_506]